MCETEEWSSEWTLLVDGDFYDLTDFHSSHPGGSEIIRMTKEMNTDATAAFSMHHIHFEKAYKTLRCYLITDAHKIAQLRSEVDLKLLKEKEERLQTQQKWEYVSDHAKRINTLRYDDNGKQLLPQHENEPNPNPDYLNTLPNPGSFYFELRKAVLEYFQSIPTDTDTEDTTTQDNAGIKGTHGTKRSTNRGIDTGPTVFYHVMWWIHLSAALCGLFCQYYLRSLKVAPLVGMLNVFCGGYNHQHFHMPKWRNYAYFLDWMGLWSYQFQREHLLLHHVYTNTVKDNHWEGTDPFAVVDPHRKRNLIQRFLVPIYIHFVLAVGIFGNYIFNVQNIIRGKTKFQIGILMFPLHCITYILLVQNVVLGIEIFLIVTCVSSYWYFTIALMNHNQSETWNLQRITSAKDWGEFQLATSCDIGYNYGYIGSMFCLWLNYHTIHHLVPTTDMSHHRSLQVVLDRVSDKFGLQYNYKSFFEMWVDMVTTFTIPRALEHMIR